ncbi:MAG: tRNA (adenosine(37)-N6)-threonylcarbamoyltransferase complex ATPase subunit type 1 TsaE [Candidatus Sungbacteria bacterium RIFCSPHIGHO2_01_FULL_50_25]|uniref:tRNA threonylcarbamoyladenosine biosynthesis protein TsaE n=1 Tax=Candidatus Sungbacteria bacterium RIFCSPHIGHO2_01_FULL_50_25 TaxID=1802265 RepID=A0A1G2KBI2_9BACT|nr:MAG: tRNA (adenosine(37)-N6)-threonylcarbamoyltransferase complex ATPase subunit type 1 TsaE [Candidatus Sungbacteria bacterium RIFCSPHIGHO2_01_FULL_50_25]
MHIRTKNKRETEKIASILAKEVARARVGKGAAIIALSGNLGAGKTTFAQGFARALGIRERVLSPTFVIMKIYAVQKRIWTRHFVHIDCYRMRSACDIAPLGVKEIFKDTRAIVVVEWPERIRRLIPRNALWVRFRHGKRESERDIYILRK